MATYVKELMKETYILLNRTQIKNSEILKLTLKWNIKQLTNQLIIQECEIWIEYEIIWPEYRITKINQ